jgi:hypothetical protein
MIDKRYVEGFGEGVDLKAKCISRNGRERMHKDRRVIRPNLRSPRLRPIAIGALSRTPVISNKSR